MYLLIFPLYPLSLVLNLLALQLQRLVIDCPQCPGTPCQTSSMEEEDRMNIEQLSNQAQWWHQSSVLKVWGGMEKYEIKCSGRHVLGVLFVSLSFNFGFSENQKKQICIALLGWFTSSFFLVYLVPFLIVCTYSYILL